ncbi:MAG: acyloxyacyl hydrolase [Bacteroidales bacterium]|nr:acyloxyacyl hydrolase [Bacteroidales bacterium]
MSAQDNDLFKKNSTSNNYQMEARFYYGFINNYHNELKIFNAHIPAFEIGFRKLTNGNQAWQSNYNYPSIGLHFFYTPFQKSSSLGNAYAMYPSIDFPLLASSKQLLNFRIGLGLAYFDSKFDPIENYQNLAIGSDLNAFVHFMIHYEMKISSLDQISVGLSLVHFSNGSISMPNYGLNLPLSSIGYTHQFKENNELPERKAMPFFRKEVEKNYRIDFQLGYAIKSRGIEIDSHDQVVASSISLLKIINAKSAVGIGTDFSYDESHRALLNLVNNQSYSNIELVKFGGAVQYQIQLDRLALNIALGTYIYGKEKTEGPIYEKLSLNYRFYKNMYASMELKAHAARAAYLAWGIGYQLHFKKSQI